MNLRRLGRAGLKLPELSLGSCVTYRNPVDCRAARELMAAAFDAGVNFFDNAEVYARGQAEEIMGGAPKDLRWPRIGDVVSTKLFWGLGTGINGTHTLNCKDQLYAIDGPLARLLLDFVDLAHCHRPGPHTPAEELASGLRTGKYRSGVPAGSRGAVQGYAFLRGGLIDPARNAIVDPLEAVARDRDRTLALAWCLKNWHAPSVITGATRIEPIRASLRAPEFVPKLAPEVLARSVAVVVGAVS